MKRDSYGALAGASIPAAILRASATLKLAGNIGFWVQIILGVVAALILLFASASLVGGDGPNASQDPRFVQGSSFGLFCAAAGIVGLIVSIFFFFRYKTIARLMLAGDNSLRPKKSYTIQTIKFGLLANLLGMMFAIIGAEAFVGLVLGKSLTIPQGAVFSNTSQLIQPKDLFIILANTHTIASHFTGIVIALWLLDRLNK
ncbi:hypothetical protein NIES970_01810 [[Synechococcus] sp. NIES-970]|jgi:hypothetical protein|uniref:DUF3611 family protein n=1 Tax=Picosynechococcus sp. NKBG15041c TaxID=1407650 RepID=UPI0004230E68|nr:DUF3611 family protein [Picosynechococcus sp. NKBG15041c]BAW95279.1 hypothetical protein NIES970_01810 [[Synechococcus] sp. NIES-970]